MSAKGRRKADGPRLHLHTDRVRLYHGDSLRASLVLAPESIDALVTDPPAGISFMGKEWDGDKGGRDAWIEWLALALAGAMVALKPGAHALVWALPRTAHWTMMAVDDAGFEVRDVIAHLFGTGFPKSLDVAKAIDAATLAGGSRPEDLRRLAQGDEYSPSGRGRVNYDHGAGSAMNGATTSGGVTEAGAQWSGWGTALKPGAEFWILARKPLAGTVASNVQAHGTGALNVEGCRIRTTENLNGGAYSEGGRPSGLPGDDRRPAGVFAAGGGRLAGQFLQPAGRWPANVVLSHLSSCTDDACAPGCAVAMLDEQSGERTTNPGTARRDYDGGMYSPERKEGTVISEGSSGGASRFFYCAKPSRAEKDAGLDHLPVRTGGEATDREDGSAGLLNPRAGAGRTGGARNHHPTVKSVDLMRWLCRLITPPGGTVLDLFAGSGTTGLAALREGFRFVGFEQDAAFADVAAGRLAHVECVAPPEPAAEDVKVETPTQPSLFGALAGGR